MDDTELFSTIRRSLNTAVLGDVLDQMGLRRCFLPAGLSPLTPDTVMIGRAMSVLEADVFDDGTADAAGPLTAKPFGLMLEALDNLRTGEIYVATGASPATPFGANSCRPGQRSSARRAPFSTATFATRAASRLRASHASVGASTRRIRDLGAR